MRAYRPSNVNYILYALFGAFLFILYKGYLFGSSDQSEHLPQVYQLFDSTLFTKDYFVNAYNEAFNIRFYYVWLVFLLANIFTVEWTCFLLTIASITLVNYSFMKITRHINSNEIAPYLVPLFIMATVDFTIGGNHVMGNMFVCSSIAKALAAFGIYHFFKEKYYKMAILLGAATLFQALVGLQLALILGVITAYYLIRKKNWIYLIKIWVLYFLIAGFMLVPLVYQQFFGNEKYNMELYYYLMYIYRNPLHFLPSLFPLSDYIRFFILLAIGITVLFIGKFFMRRKLFVFLIIILAGMGVYALFIEVFHLNVTGKLQWFKTTVWAASFAAMIIAIGFSELLSKWFHHFHVLPLMRIFVPVGLIVFPLVILNASQLPIEKLKSRYQIANYKKTDLQLMHAWIKDNTPKDAVFLIPPDDDAFACEAQRSQVVGFKAIIHEPRFLIPWYLDIVKAYGIDSAKVGRKTNAAELLLNSYNNRTNDQISLKFEYRLDHLKDCRILNKLGPEIHRSGEYVLTKTSKSN